MAHSFPPRRFSDLWAFTGEQCPVWFQYLVSVLAAHFGLPRGIADQRGGGLPQYDADRYGQPAPDECFGASDQCCAGSKRCLCHSRCLVCEPPGRQNPIGRASRRERVCPYVELAVDAASLKT